MNRKISLLKGMLGGRIRRKAIDREGPGRVIEGVHFYKGYQFTLGKRYYSCEETGKHGAKSILIHWEDLA